ncbi:MAG: hypothetical protein AAF546_00140 [Verrucomicrobiota bacterium]
MKYENTNPLSNLHNGEPYFFLRAQDKLAPSAVRDYAHHLAENGDIEGARECASFADRMANWQRANPDKVKIPD